MVKKVTIPRVPAKVDKELRPFLTAVAEAVQVSTGQRGNELDKAVTFRDLTDQGFAVRKNGVFRPVVRTINDGGGSTDEYSAADITAPTNATATGMFGAVGITRICYRG